MLGTLTLVRFHVPAEASWPAIARRTTGLGEHLTDAVRAVSREYLPPKVAEGQGQSTGEFYTPLTPCSPPRALQQ